MRAQLREILPQRDRQDCQFSVLCRHLVVKRPRCGARRGVETGINEGKRIQTLFLEIAENPPQLRHMTFRKGNATRLPPPTQLAAAQSRLRDFPQAPAHRSPPLPDHTHGAEPSPFRAF